MDIMQTLGKMFARLQQNPGDVKAQLAIENIIIDLECSLFQATAARVRDILDATLQGEIA